MFCKEKTDIRPCLDCKELKHKSLFTKNHVFGDGFDTLCLACNYRRVCEWRAKGKRNSGEESRKRWAKYPEKCLEHARIGSQRRSTATPKWLGDGIFLIKEAKRLARLRTLSTGFLWHIDHIIPIGSKLVCGLNVPWNIRVVPAAVNRTKADKIIEGL